jgi:hypothetical protein
MHMHGVPRPIYAINLTFDYVSRHTLQYNNPDVSAIPAIPAVNRLYVIENHLTHRWFYIGTAADVASRFTGRFTACRELGFGQNEVGATQVYIVNVLTNGASTPPGDNGRTWGPPAIDVEHLLIRTYVSGLHQNVRNINKIAPFPNYQGVALNVALVDHAGLGFPLFNFVVANGALW